MCAGPCYREETGRFTATRSGNRTLLRLTPRQGAAVTYTAAKGSRLLTLTRNGKREYLAAVSAGQCNGQVDCKVNEQCPQPVCLMMNACEPNDPTCCTSTCQPSDPAPPQDPCFGAWVDESNACRGPADQVLPIGCCVAL